MNELLIFIWTGIAMISMSFWEAYSEGRKAWGEEKLGWTLKIGKNISLPAYHFYIFFVMLPFFYSLPLIVNGWDLHLFGVLLSAYFIGITLEDFIWYVVNPVVKFKEWFTSFSDYYPWIKIKGRKIIPAGYVLAILISLASWWFLWR